MYRFLVQFAVFSFLFTLTYSIKCFSCASENLEDNFQTRLRRPPGRIVGMPLMFDNSCDLDYWILRKTAAVDCSSACYKWQQIVNNSGVYSYMTVRACYDQLFGSMPQVTQEATCTGNVSNLTCLPEANLIENACICQSGDFCNKSTQMYSIHSHLIVFIILTLLMPRILTLFVNCFCL